MRVPAALLLLPLLVCVRAEEPPPLERRAREVATMISANPAWSEGVFDESFRNNVTPGSLRALLKRIYDADGSVTSVLPVRAEAAAGRFELRFSGGSVRQLDLRLAGERIRYLYVHGPVPGFEDLEAAAEALRGLRGSVSFAACRLGPMGPERIAGVNPDAVLDVASAFKLHVLGALVRDVEAGRRKWTDTVALDPRRRCIPTGILQGWPAGSSVTLHTLAALMISESDNTATDHLLFLLGRETVEAMLPAMGHAHADRNAPLLSTGEMFRLKYADGGKHADAYLRGDEAQRRAYLREVLEPIPLDRVDSPASTTTPCRIEAIGWFASAMDLCAAMAWLRAATEEEPTAAARAVLAIRPGTEDPRDVFPYQGYKGGRLPGIACRAYLARSAAGDWFAVAAVWNDAKEDIDEARLAGILTRVLQLLARATAR